MLSECDRNENCFSLKVEKCGYCQIQSLGKRESTLSVASVKRIRTDLCHDKDPIYKRIPTTLLPMSEAPLEKSAKLAEKQRNMYDVIAYAIHSFFPKIRRPLCYVCYYFENEKKVHHVLQCPKMENRCFRCCLSDHLAPDCKLKKVKFQEVCVKCAMPFENPPNIVFHSGAICETSAKDNLDPFLMYLWLKDRFKIKSLCPEMKLENDSTYEFFKWIHTKIWSITHGMELFYRVAQDKRWLK